MIHKTKANISIGTRILGTTQRLDSRIQAADMKVIPLIKGVAMRDKIRNADIHEEFHIKPILDVLREGKFRWLGHVMTREPHSMLHEVVNYKVTGTRPRGRPKERDICRERDREREGERVDYDDDDDDAIIVSLETPVRPLYGIQCHV